LPVEGHLNVIGGVFKDLNIDKWKPEKLYLGFSSRKRFLVPFPPKRWKLVVETC
jgi:hypothetical protein